MALRPWGVSSFLPRALGPFLLGAQVPMPFTFISVDTETELFSTYFPAPDLCCLTVAVVGEDAQVQSKYLVDTQPGSGIADHWQGLVLRALREPDTYLVGHHMAYDLRVLARATGTLGLVFLALEHRKILDTGFAQRFLEVAGLQPFKGDSTQSLDSLSRQWGLGAMDKDDAIRLTFGQFIGKPLPKAHADYAIGDAANTGIIAARQVALATKVYPSARAFLSTVGNATHTFFGLGLQSSWGMLVEDGAVEAYRQEATEQLLHMRRIAWDNNLLRVDAAVKTKKAAGWPGKYAKDMGGKAIWARDFEPLGVLGPMAARPEVIALKMWCLAQVADPASPAAILDQAAQRAAVQRAYGAMDPPQPTPMTEESAERKKKARKRAEEGRPMEPFKPQTSISSETLARSEDPVLEAIAELAEWSKALSTDVALMESGVLQCRYDICESGRTRTSKPNIQNFRQKGKADEVAYAATGGFGPCTRECSVPRPGHVFLDLDYPALEVHSLAEVMFQKLGLRDLVDRILAGVASGTPYDPHMMLAAVALGIRYEEGLARKKEPHVKDVRQRHKAATFAFPVGASAATFVNYCAKGGVTVTLAEAEQIKRVWAKANPQNVAMLNNLSSRRNARGKYDTTIWWTGIEQRNSTFCAVANAEFQGSGAAVAWRAIQLMARRCYVLDRDPKWHPLFGCRPVAFVHDQLVVECPSDRYRTVAVLLEDLMQEAAMEVLPTCGVALRPVAEAMAHWSKRDGTYVKNADGSLGVFALPGRRRYDGLG